MLSGKLISFNYLRTLTYYQHIVSGVYVMWLPFGHRMFYENTVKVELKLTKLVAGGNVQTVMDD